MKPLRNSTILFTLLFLITQISWAQLENANWYFGDHAGLNFENTTSVLTDGQTNNIYNETASVSDSNGNLLFYTDGHTVWNKNQTAMQGSDSTLNGDFVSTVIIPFPGQSKKYYTFTLRYYYSAQYNETRSEYLYSIVDMNYNNGLGKVTTLQNSLGLLPVFDNDMSVDRYAEKKHISVAKHSDGESFWLILNPFYKFYTFKIDFNGINTTPIISNCYGSHYGGAECEGRDNGSASMVISPDNSKIAFLNISSTPRTNGYCRDPSFLDLLLIYNFNNTNGAITSFYINGDYDWLGNLNYASSVEFSPNSNFLYVLGTNPTKIIQYNLNNISNNPISISENYNESYNNLETPILHRSMNGKIYIPSINSYKLSVINNPNSSGVNCNFVENQINLGSGQTLKLPPLVQIHESSCVQDLTITSNVNSAQTDIQESSNTITATNSIFANATAEYDAGNIIYLKPNFHAKYGANFRAYIEGCNATLRKQSKKKNYQYENNETVFSKPNLDYVTLYPNPTKGFITVESTKDVSSWILTDAYGKSYFSGTNAKETINITNLPKSIYFLKAILTNGKVVMKKVIKN